MTDNSHMYLTIIDENISPFFNGLDIFIIIEGNVIIIKFRNFG